MMRRIAFWLLLCSTFLCAAVPTPKEHFGFTPGDDYKLADYAAISSYYQKLAQSTDRMKLVEFGKTSEGKPMYLAIFSSPENLAKLEEFKAINRKLALAEVSEAEAKKLATQAKAIVWIDSGLHASEVAPAQHSPHLAYRMVTDESDEAKRIRQNVILLQIPVINPDGLDHVAHWYAKNVGTPYELAPLPVLYQKYAGHDNNRDWYMMNLPETQQVSRLLFLEWFPHIVYNQHQAPPFPARIFVPPYGEPLNPNIPAPVMEGINLIGSAMKERFARENKPGVVSYLGFDAWWNGGLRSVPAFHNMHGILTETALYGYGTPFEYKPAAIPERFSTGIPAKQPSVFYERPWLGGRWGTREAIEYMLTGDFAILDLASTRSEHFAYKAFDIASKNIAQGKSGQPYAYIISPNQWDPSSATEMVKRLAMSGVQVQRATAPFQVNGKQYPAGTMVLPAAQPFRGYLVDLMEAQKYPDLRTGPNGSTKRPYDIAGWTLPMQMNVAVDRVEDTFLAKLEPQQQVPNYEPALRSQENAAFFAVADALKKGTKIVRKRDGSFAAGSASDALYELQTPRVAIYEPYTANMDTGWTQWLFDHYKIPFTVLRNADIQKGDLRSRFDTVVLASQAVNSILHGYRDGERLAGRNETGPLQRPEYTGGIGTGGVFQLEQFVRQGGTLMTFAAANELPLQFFGVPVRNALQRTGGEGGEEGGGASSFYCPGSLLRGTLDPTHPIAFGMPKEFVFFSDGGQAFETTLLQEYNKGDRQVRTVASYAAKDVLASGFLTGERAVQGKGLVAESRLGQGRVVMFGFRPQHRGQSYGTFKLILNTIYWASGKPAS